MISQRSNKMILTLGISYKATSLSKFVIFELFKSTQCPELISRVYNQCKMKITSVWMFFSNKYNITALMETQLG